MEFIKELNRRNSERKNGRGGAHNVKHGLYRKYKNGVISSVEYKDLLAKEMGYKNKKDYEENLVKRKGYKDWNEYCRFLRYRRGEGLSLGENKDSSQYLGIYVAERLLPSIFENSLKMPYGNKGYDFICSNGYKIDVKSSCLRSDNSWAFVINKNKIANYFLLIAFDDRENLDVLNIWLIEANEDVGIKIVKRMNEFEKFTIFNTMKSLTVYNRYRISDKMKKVRDICEEFKIKEFEKIEE